MTDGIIPKTQSCAQTDEIWCTFLPLTELYMSEVLMLFHQLKRKLIKIDYKMHHCNFTPTGYQTIFNKLLLVLYPLVPLRKRAKPKPNLLNS